MLEESSEDPDESFDVIIIGAGISGLNCAYTILSERPDARVVVLEALDRVGGRTKGFKTAGGAGFDLGGQFVNTDLQPLVTALLARVDLETFEQPKDGRDVFTFYGASYRSYRNLSPWVQLDLYLTLRFKLDPLWKRLLLHNPLGGTRATELDAMSVQQWMDTAFWTAGAKHLLASLCRSIWGVEPAEVSFLFFLFYLKSGHGPFALADDAQRDRVRGGAFQLAQRLAQRCQVRLQHAVKAVVTADANADADADVDTEELIRARVVHVYCACGGARSLRLAARRVVFACPPTQLARVDLHPPLPALQRCVGERAFMGHWIKCVLTFAAPFWRERGFSGSMVCADGGDPCMYYFDAREETEHALVGFVGSDAAARWSGRGEAELRAASLAQLRERFGEPARLTGFYAQDWTLEPYVGGCPVNHYPPGLLTVVGNVLRVPVHHWHFAGTETALHWNGYMEGAVESGERAAKEVLHELWRADFEEAPHVKSLDELVFLRRRPEQKSSILAAISLLIALAIIITVLILSVLIISFT